MRKYRLLERSSIPYANISADHGLDKYGIKIGSNLVTSKIYLENSDSESVVQYITYPNISVPHATSTRIGGVSSGNYSSLNIGQTTEDVPRYVHENRLRLEVATGIAVNTILDMVHGTKVVKINELPKTRRIGDACMTDRSGLPLGITTADCVPLIMHDPVRGVLSIVHTGWRGTVARIAKVALKAMVGNYGTNLCDVQVAIGPSIGPCCFEVGYEVAQQFNEAFSGQELARIGKNGKILINLWLANVKALLECGLAPENICASCLCSACNGDLFYSYRRDKCVTGRIATIAMLPEII